MHHSILKKLSDYLSKPLALIFKGYLETEEPQACWKTAEVIPIFKKGNISNPGNYRHVGLTVTLCKALEKLVKDGFITHIATNNLFFEYQHGFLKGKSCNTNLYIIFSLLMTQKLPKGSQPKNTTLRYKEI